MQVVHDEKLLIDAFLPPPCFKGASRERVSLSREAKAFDRLELPVVGDLRRVIRNVSRLD